MTDGAVKLCSSSGKRILGPDGKAVTTCCVAPLPCGCGTQAYNVSWSYHFQLGEDACDTSYSTVLTPVALGDIADTGWLNTMANPGFCHWDNGDDVGGHHPCLGTCATPYTMLVSFEGGSVIYCGVEHSLGWIGNPPSQWSLTNDESGCPVAASGAEALARYYDCANGSLLGSQPFSGITLNDLSPV